MMNILPEELVKSLEDAVVAFESATAEEGIMATRDQKFRLARAAAALENRLVVLQAVKRRDPKNLSPLERIKMMGDFDPKKPE